MFEGQPGTFDRIGPPMLGLFPLIMMFLITSITMLRERTTGTLERLMTMPMSKLDLLVGYGIAFALLAALQAAVTTRFAYGVLGLTTVGFGVLGGTARDRECRAGDVARVARERVRSHGVPGGAVHAGVRAAADPAVRPARSRAARWRAGCTRSRAPCPSRTPTTRWRGRRRAIPSGRVRARCRGGRRGHPALSRARGGDAAATDRMGEVWLFWPRLPVVKIGALQT